MRPPAIELRIVKPAPGVPWEYVARVKGEAIDAGEGFDQPGRALVAAIESVRAFLAAPPAPTIEGGEE